MRGRVICSERPNKPDRYFLGDDEVTKEEFDVAFPTKPMGVPMLGGNTSAGWPMKSDAMAVHPSQIPAVMARNKKHNLHIDYDPVDGRAILNDRAARRDLMKLENFHDNNGGYGDDHHIAGSTTPPEYDFKEADQVLSET